MEYKVELNSLDEFKAWWNGEIDEYESSSVIYIMDKIKAKK